LSDPSSKSSNISSKMTFKQFIPKTPVLELDEKPVNGLPFRIKETVIEVEDGEDLAVSVSPTPDDRTIIYSLQPPTEPATPNQRAPCDLVLVIDVSGSMDFEAPLPDASKGSKESAGLSILDLVKHAARTILETLDQNDRLSLVTFGYNATVVSDLTPMNVKGKQAMNKCINDLRAEGATNLWAGISTGLKVFAQASRSNNVPSMFVLTDGQPNHMCPVQGYIPKLKPVLARMASMETPVPSIHTFGFGYDIRSGLLQSIAELGLGSYAFIPDAGMIGTVFVHAVANQYATFATEVTIQIPDVKSTRRVALPTVFNSSVHQGCLTMRLGNLQFGQTRNLVVKFLDDTYRFPANALIAYRNLDGDLQHIQLSQSSVKCLPQQEIEYHMLRSKLCTAIAELFPVKSNGEHEPLEQVQALAAAGKTLKALAASTSRNAEPSPAYASILSDINGPGQAGQVLKAIDTKGHRESYWARWGRHYLPSLLHAHARQVCNSFKDPGPLQYGSNSPLFTHWRDQLDMAFDSLPAPTPSLIRFIDRRNYVPITSMSMYHNSGGSCFEGSCAVRLADGEEDLRIADLKPGMAVWTPTGARRVAGVLKTLAPQGIKRDLVRVGELWVTPWHPMLRNGIWVFPADVAHEGAEREVSVYSVLLEASENPDDHAIEVGGQVCVTLGHGLSQHDESDIRGHVFFGDYERIVQGLAVLHLDEQGRRLAVGVSRDSAAELVNGFLAPLEEVVRSQRMAKL
jgi:Mg-chelatase subunit ChlD